LTARFLLVDLESVQPAPTDVESWMSDKGSAWVFHGSHQLKLLPKYAALGRRVTIIPISRPGRNSLDFHLVFYLGYLAARNPNGQFAVLSKDTGYDPAITHARTLAFDLLRIEELGTEGAEPAKAGKAATTKPSAPRPSIAPKKAAAAKKTEATRSTPAGAKKAIAKKTAAVIEAPPFAPASIAAPSTAARSSTRALGAIYRDILQGLRTQAHNRPKSRRALERHVQTQIGLDSAPDTVRAIVDRLFTVDAVRQESGRLIYFSSGRGDASGARLSVLSATQPPAS
jgi:hypothetical protein